MRSLFLLCGIVPVLSARLTGAEPVLTHLHPAAVQAGNGAEVKLTGKFDPWPCKVWTDEPGIVFTAGKDAGTFSVNVAPGVKPGPHLIRAFNDDGASAPVAIAITGSPQTQEKEPNDDYRAPQDLELPEATCNGRMDKSDDVDSFGVTLKKGQTLVTWIEAYVLAAGYDAMLRVVDAGGNTLAFNHDSTTIDPFLVFKAPQDGRYIVQTMGQKYPASSDIRFAGGDDCVYRLHVSTSPVVRNTWPLAVPRGQKSQVALEGWNLTTKQAEINDTAPPPCPVTFSDIPELTETAEPQTLAIPSAVSARIEPAGDDDRFAFAAVKGDVLELSVTGPDMGSTLDGWLKVFDKDGKELASSDDAGGSSDPRLVWTAPGDGTFTAAVGEVTQRGGNDFFYRLAITKPEPSVSATIAVHSAKVEAGKSVELKVVASFAHGFQRKLKLAAKDLPAGVTASEPDVSEKGGEVAITLTAAPAAARAAQPFQFVLREVEGGRERPVAFSMISTSENNGVPQGYRQLLINSTSQLWLTVIPAPPPPAPAPPPPPAEAEKKP